MAQGPVGDPTPPQVQALARRFEPVLRYTQGELFLPISAEDYVARSALLRRRDADTPEVVVAREHLDLATLGEVGAAYAADALELQYVEQALDRAAYRQWRRRSDRPAFHADSRLDAVSLFGRIIDAVLRLSLVLRGRVPGGFAAAAETKYRASGAAEHPTYHVRGIRDGGYLVLQYWFCYVMNDWRSTFSGVNDHECDWEQITLFLTESADGTVPELAWVAFSSHDEVGDDLRRRVDDPDLQLVDGTHPVVVVGAGSHSGAYLAGDYVVRVTPPAMDAWVRRRDRLMGALMPWTRRYERKGLGIPYIDYRRGDGVGVGPGTGVGWAVVVINEATPWVRDYQGLWGYDTRDRFGGERAPAGPRYERDGTVRASWDRPVAWAGLDKQPPDTDAETAALAARDAALESAIAAAQAQLAAQREQLRAVHEGARAAGHAAAGTGKALAAAQAEVDATWHTLAGLRAERDAVRRALGTGLPADPVHAHLRHRAVPDTAAARPAGWARKVWSATSVSVLLLGLAAVLLHDLGDPGLAVLVLVVLAIDAVVRGWLVRYVEAVLALAALGGGVWLLVYHGRIVIAALLVVVGVTLLVSNLGSQLRSR